MTRVLVVDDEQEILNTTGELLELAGFEALMEIRADRVLGRMREDLPDVVLHDYRMPGLDLKVQVGNVRSDPKIAKIPIIIFTASLVSHAYADEAGADGFLEKPFTADELLDAINAAVEGKA